MKVIVDTCVWSQALRKNRQKDNTLINTLIELIKEIRVQLIGPIRQELLSGIKYERQFNELRDYLAAFPDFLIETKEYEKAAEFYNLCRSKGIQGSNTDFLICAIAVNYGYEILTIDKDFENFQKHLPIQLYK